MTTNPALGSRVVLRYRLPPGSSHRMTDVIGELVALDATVAVRTSENRIVRVARDRVVALKALGPRPIRTREIRSLEIAAADAWPGIEHEWIDGWLVRYGKGFTGRANSATPLGEPGTVADPNAGDTAERLRSWFAGRGQSLRLLLPDRLARIPDGWSVGDEVLVLTAGIDDLVLPSQRPRGDVTGASAATGDVTVTVTDHLDADWLSLYRYRGAEVPVDAHGVLEAVDGVVGFGRIDSADIGLSAVARAAVTTAPDGHCWVGLTAVEVTPAHRRRGLGTLICIEMVRWGRGRGATQAYLQVAAENAPARAMYHALGFTEHHRYRYATRS